MDNTEILSETKRILKDNYNKVMVPFFLMVIISAITQNQDIISNIYDNYGVVTGTVYSLISVVITAVIGVGLASFSLSIVEGRTDTNKLKDGLNVVPKAVVIYLLYVVAIVVGLLLLVIPGLIVGIMFSQVFFILSKDPDVDVVDAFKQSAAMMNGYKWQYLWLSLRYGLYFVLSIFTLFIWTLWLLPQMYTSYALFHAKVSGSYEKQVDDVNTHLVE